MGSRGRKIEDQAEIALEILAGKTLYTCESCGEEFLEVFVEWMVCTECLLEVAKGERGIWKKRK